MSSEKKQEQVATLLKENLGRIFQEQSTAMFNGAFITVTFVEVAPDLSHAKIYLSIFVPKDKERIFRMVEEQMNEIRRLLGQRVRNKLRKMPDFTFVLDDSPERAERIDELLKKDRNKGKNE